uniref:SCAN box domain-containing protein n=1 Tax=Echinostoma caproni TaxID=27848 RepID=A0A183AHE2_9TREM
LEDTILGVRRIPPRNRNKQRDADREINTDISGLMSTKAERYVRTWMHTAQPLERELAVEFFAKFRQQTKEPSECEKRFVELKEDMKSNRFRFIIAFPHPPITNPVRDRRKEALSMPRNPLFSHGDGSTQLKHLQLLSPEQRRDRWMSQTWHHLPPYRISKEAAERDCRQSHYNQPRKPMPPYYVIHPDME